MEIIQPTINGAHVPEGTRFVTYAKDQPPYLPLPSAKTPDGRVISAWKPSAGELALISSGVPIYITLHTGNEPLQPIMVTVGQPNLSEK